MKYTYNHPMLHPTLFQSTINGKLYIVPTWQEVEPGTTLNDITWIKPIQTKPITASTVKGSDGSTYTVTFDSNKKSWRCTCPGYFRCRDKTIGCKHCQEARSRVSKT